jgi:hypothetical protein
MRKPDIMPDIGVKISPTKQQITKPEKYKFEKNTQTRQ